MQINKTRILLQKIGGKGKQNIIACGNCNGRHNTEQERQASNILATSTTRTNKLVHIMSNESKRRR